MRSILISLCLAASSLAYQVTGPSNSSGWTATGPNSIDWQTVDTDQPTFAVVLVNQDRSILPTNNQLVLSNVSGSLGSLTVPTPPGGFPVGPGFQVNFVEDAQDVNTLLAQSNQFSIVAGGSSTSSGASTTSSSGSISSGSTLSSASTTATESSSSGFSSVSGSSSASSSTSPSPSPSSAASHLSVQNGLMSMLFVVGAFLI